MTRFHSPACTLFVALAIAVGAARADYKADIGWTKLQAEVGGSLPNGAGVPVTQVEAPESVGNYGPNPANPEFAGKTLTFKSGAAGNSGHATTVAGYYYGLNGSIAPGITAIDVYEVNNWLGSGFLRRGSVFSPNAEPNAIQSHSWIGSFDSGGTNDIEVLRRFDSAIQQSEFLGIVGLNNFAANNVPALLAGNYNGISVGRSDSFHSYGTNTADGTGRTKPELVAPFDATSWATPSVAATAAMLRQNAPANGKKVVSLKSILLAGATKHQFPGWSRTLTRPIDSVFGAGQLSAYRSYHILNAGQQPASTTASVGIRGWDLNTTRAAGRLYFFDIAAGNTAPALSALVTWNRTIGGAWPAASTSTLANLTLKLYAATGFTKGTLIDSSESAVDNIEHIYQPSLPPGRYALEVTGDANSITYGLAWYSQPTVTIAPVANAAEQGLINGTFAITRAGDLSAPLTIAYTVTGSATAGTDYQSLPGTITIPALAASANVNIVPLADTLAEGTETATLTIIPDIAYSLGTTPAASLSIADLPIDAWRFDRFTAPELADPQLSGDTADFDKDGIVNLLEYALDLDPKVSSPALPYPTVAGGTLRLTYTKVKAATDITYTVEVGNEVGAWNSGPTYTHIVGTIDNGSTQTITAESLLALDPAQKQFIRLRITRP